MAGAELVGLGAADQQAEASVRHDRDVAQVESHEIETPQRSPEAQQKHGAIAGAKRRVGGGAGREETVQHLWYGCGRSGPHRQARPAGESVLASRSELNFLEVSLHVPTERGA